jgi:hypothetical protein
MQWLLPILAIFPFSFWGITSSGGGGSACADVTFLRLGPASVQLHTSTSGAHIFYTVNVDTGIDPTHAGDTATGATSRIANNFGTISRANNGSTYIVRAMAYKSGLTDSSITEFSLDTPGP